MNSNIHHPATLFGARLSAAILVAVISLASPTGLLWAGGVYKSVDAQGHVVYSDQPDMSVPQTQVDIAGGNSYADVDMRTEEAPPPLQDSDQPVCPVDGYLWTPGFWAWSAAGYYWVAGEWVEPPRVGVLWTPGYWEYADDVYLFHLGYWAPEVGYYGGIDYGFGYFGVGYAGGRWVGNSFAYNRNVSNIGTRPYRNIYSEASNYNGAHNRVSYNGGPGGVLMAATAQQRVRMAESHIPPTLMQRQQLAQAARIPTPVPQVSNRMREVEANSNRLPMSNGANSASNTAPRAPLRSVAAPPAYVQRGYVPPPQNQTPPARTNVTQPRAPTAKSSTTARASVSRAVLTR